MNGGPGNDHFFEQAASGRDTADYRTSTAGVTVFLRNTQPSDDGLGGEDRFDSIENVYGSKFDDQLTGDIVPNVIRGRGGDDLMRGQQGNDTISGGAGNDTAYGGLGYDNCIVEVPSSC